MNAKEAVKKTRSEFMNWAQAAPLKELKEVFKECSPHGSPDKWDIARTEISARQHAWTKWGIWIMVATLAFAAIAAFPVIESWFSTKPNEQLTPKSEAVQPVDADNQTTRP
jgi:hypothetical protein